MDKKPKAHHASKSRSQYSHPSAFYELAGYGNHRNYLDSLNDSGHVRSIADNNHKPQDERH